MSGWKTWLGVIGSFAYALYLILTGNTTEAFNYLLIGISLLGIGHKIDKLKPF